MKPEKIWPAVLGALVPEHSPNPHSAKGPPGWIAVDFPAWLKDRLTEAVTRPEDAPNTKTEQYKP